MALLAPRDHICYLELSRGKLHLIGSRQGPFDKVAQLFGSKFRVRAAPHCMTRCLHRPVTKFEPVRQIRVHAEQRSSDEIGRTQHTQRNFDKPPPQSAVLEPPKQSCAHTIESSACSPSSLSSTLRLASAKAQNGTATANSKSFCRCSGTTFGKNASITA